MDINPIRTESDYREAVKRIETLMDARENTPEGDLLDVLVTLVEAYEAKRYPIDLPNAISAIKFYMEQNGLSPKDMVQAFGRLNRVYKVLNSSRPLTLNMIRKLHYLYGIQIESLIKKSVGKIAV